MERKKLELQLNLPTQIELLFDEPVVGQSKFGEYYLYAVRNGDGTEYSFFAPEEVHAQLRTLKKGSKAVITKLAEQKASKILTKFDIKVIQATTEEPKKVSSHDSGTVSKDSYYEVMVTSYEDAMKIQEKLNGMVDVNRIAITLFIARSKVNGGSYG